MHITIQKALEQNKEVMAVPGRIGDILSEGCNELIKQGAMVITNPEDIRLSSFITKWIKDSEMGKTNLKYPTKNEHEKINVLASEKNMLYSLLGLCPISLEEIVRQSGLDIQSTIEILLELQLNGYIKEVGHNRYIRNSL